MVSEMRGAIACRRSAGGKVIVVLKFNELHLVSFNDGVRFSSRAVSFRINAWLNLNEFQNVMGTSVVQDA